MHSTSTRAAVRQAIVIGAATWVALAGAISAQAAPATVTARVSPASQRAAAAGLRPIVFVHGLLGSGSQYETQAMRFAANGYPANWIQANDYDSTFSTTTQDKVYQALDERIARLEALAGTTQVDLLGHSMGTSILQGYLNSSPARAAEVAHYVNIDGVGATKLPGGVPTLGIWGEQNTGTITGASELRLPNQSHVQTTTSPEAFTAEYTFFTGHAPATTALAPQPGAIQLGGRAVSFPSNVGVHNATLSVYTVDPATGRRTGQTPVASYRFGAAGDGSFGPFEASSSAHYEFAIQHAGSAEVHHLYYQPFPRTDLDIRLLSTDPGTGVEWLVDRSAKYSGALIYRNKEFWGDQGASGDTLTVNGTQILNANTAPRSRRTIGLFVFDQHNDGVSNVNTAPGLLSTLPFLSGTDLSLPASPNGTGTLTITQRPRDGGGHTDTLVVPNWPGDTNVTTVNLDDYIPTS